MPRREGGFESRHPLHAVIAQLGRGARLRTGRIGVRIPVAARERHRVIQPEAAAVPGTTRLRAHVPMPELRSRVRVRPGRRTQLLRRVRVHLVFGELAE